MSDWVEDRKGKIPWDRLAGSGAALITNPQTRDAVVYAPPPFPCAYCGAELPVEGLCSCGEQP